MSPRKVRRVRGSVSEDQGARAILWGDVRESVEGGELSRGEVVDSAEEEDGVSEPVAKHPESLATQEDHDLTVRIAQVIGWTEIRPSDAEPFDAMIRPLWGKPPRFRNERRGRPQEAHDFGIEPVPYYPYWWDGMRDLVEWIMDGKGIEDCEIVCHDHGDGPIWFCKLSEKGGREIHLEMEDRPALAVCKAALWLDAELKSGRR